MLWKCVSQGFSAGCVGVHFASPSLLIFSQQDLSLEMHKYFGLCLFSMSLFRKSERTCSQKLFALLAVWVVCQHSPDRETVGKSSLLPGLWRQSFHRLHWQCFSWDVLFLRHRTSCKFLISNAFPWLKLPFLCFWKQQSYFTCLLIFFWIRKGGFYFCFWFSPCSFLFEIQWQPGKQ